MNHTKHLGLVGCGVLLLVMSGCVHRYDTKEFTPTDAEIRAATGFAYPANDPPDRVNKINEIYPVLAARCLKVRAGMQSEADSISMKNSIIGSSFAGLTAGLAAASGLYASIKGQDANPTVTALLAFGAGGSSVPTFFFFGSDDREKVVRSRMTKLDERLSHVIEAWSSFKSVDRQFLIVNDDREEAVNATKKLMTANEDCEHADAAKKAQCQLAVSKADEQNKKYREVIAQWHQATDALDDAVVRLSDACR